MKRISMRSCAKINLGHEILHRRTDGYHEVRTILQTVDLSDGLTFERTDAEEVHLNLSGRPIRGDRRNLILQAADLLRAECSPPFGAAIDLKKNIPVGAGLGGGSSNASCTILALTRLWDLDLDPSHQQRIARSLGSDAPFFFLGGTALGIGRGDEIYPLADLSRHWALILTPPIVLSTEEAYERHSSHLTTKADTSRIKSFQYHAIAPQGGWAFLYNDFESSVFLAYPQLTELKEHLLANGARGALLSGSGSSVFGLFQDKTVAVAAQKYFQQRWGEVEVFLVPTVDRLSYQKFLNDSFC